LGIKRRDQLKVEEVRWYFVDGRCGSLFDAIERRQVQASEVREASQFIAQQQDRGRANLSLGLPLCVTIYIP
jgi:hypothetical protein